MNIKKSTIAGLMSLATLAPCKAQKTVQFVSETGITGAVNTEMSYITGMNMQITNGKNFSDVFGGLKVQADKKASFVVLAVNNYPLTKNLYTWVRETFAVSNRGANSVLQVTPVGVSVPVGKKINVLLKPAYAMYNDFKEGTVTQAVNTVFQSTYSINPKAQLFFEANYSTVPSKNLMHTHFGKPKDNISYMLTSLWNF